MKIETTSAVTVGETRIEYGIRRSKRRRTVAISVDPKLGVLLTAPVRVPVNRLDNIVQDKAPWIIKRLKLIEENVDKYPPKKFVSGETYLYLGRHFRLQVVSSTVPKPTKLEGGWLKVFFPESVGDPGRTEAVRESIIHWYRIHALFRLRERVEFWAPNVGALPPKLFVRNQAKRWGSCDSKGNLRINWRVIQAPMRLVDYIVVHEMTHLFQKGHSEAFWRAIGRLIPDYEERRKALRRIETNLHW